MVLLLIGLILFFIPHSVSIVAPAWRSAMVVKLGENAWKGIYSLISLAGLLLIIYGYGEARQSPIHVYFPPVWLRHVNALLMLFVFPMMMAAYMPGRIQAALKHPMLVAVKTWALAHLLANGTLADILLFGSFLVWAVVDRISLKRREPRAIPQLPATGVNDVIAVISGLAIYIIFIFGAHQWLFGIAPFG